MKNSIKISACIITYNHEAYIKECLEGAISQKLNCEYEIVIGEDFSSDATLEICKEYANKYPNLIRLLPREKNLGMIGNWIQTLKDCKGKYIALCEGDDYWTDPLKLQKQVDFLENNNEFVMVSGGYKIKQENNTDKEIILDKLSPIQSNKNGFEYDLNIFFEDWAFKTFTVLFRSESFDIQVFLNYKYGRDVHLFYHLLKKGKGFYFQQIFGVYNIHEGGVHSMIGNLIQVENRYKIYKEMYHINKDEITRKKYFESILIGINISNKWWFFNGLTVIHNASELVLLFKTLVASIISKTEKVKILR